MPVMLLPDDYDTWLGHANSPDEIRALLRPYDADLMEAYAVSRVVNSVKNDTEECLDPIDDEATKAAKHKGPMRQFREASHLERRLTEIITSVRCRSYGGLRREP